MLNKIIKKLIQSNTSGMISSIKESAIEGDTLIIASCIFQSARIAFTSAFDAIITTPSGVSLITDANVPIRRPYIIIICYVDISESEVNLCRGGSLRISRTSDADRHVVARERARLTNAESSPLTTSTSSSSSSSVASSDRCAGCDINSRSFRSARRNAPASDAPAPEYLARSLLQLGCPAVSMPT